MTSLEVWQRVGAVAALGALLGCVGDEPQEDEEVEPSVALGALLPAIAPRWSDADTAVISTELASGRVSPLQPALSRRDCSGCVLANPCCPALNTGGSCGVGSVACAAYAPQRH